MSERTAFLRAFLTQPSLIGSVTPSSRALTDCMISSCTIEPGDVIVELGAGTGPVTKALVETHPDNPLVVLEPDPALAGICRDAVPGADVVEAYAQQLKELLDERGLGPARRVVSSLPFAAWSEQLQRDVLDAIFDATTEDARMVTFTYGHSRWLPTGRRARAFFESRFASVRTTPMVWNNVPPALVYVCDRG